MLTQIKRWVLFRLPVLTGFRLGTVRYRGFDARDDAYYRRFADSQISHPVKYRTLEWLSAEKALPDNFSVLDIGCGPGAMARLLKADDELGPRVRYTGLDQSDGALAYCERTYPDQHFLHRDVLADGLPEEHYDVIMLNEVIEHLPGYEDIINLILARRPRIFILSTFAAIPERTRDRKLWRHDTACYMNTYAFDRLYLFLHKVVEGELRIADFGPETYDRYWFPRKERILWYLRRDDEGVSLEPSDTHTFNPSDTATC